MLDLFFDTFDVRPFVDSKGKDMNKARTPRIRPTAGVNEEDDNFVVEFLMPGMDSESLKLQVVDEELCIEASRTSTKYKQWHGKLSEKIALTEGIDCDAIEADYKNGILTVILPKKTKKQKIKEIKIN